jgi:hypothetical protein
LHFQAHQPSQDTYKNNDFPVCRINVNYTSISLFARLISHQPAVLFSQNKPATSNQPAVLFPQNKPAPAISHQPTEQAAGAWGRLRRPPP